MNPIAKLSFTTVAFLALIATAFGQVAGPPGLIDYQGQLLNSLGGPITGSGGPGTTGTAENFEIRFRIWSAQTAGNLIWAEKQIVTVSEAGLFSVRLGEGEVIATADNDPNPLTGSVANGLGALLGAFNGNERFLGVTVMDPPATPGEIQPRLAFLSAPFAVIAEKARFAEFGPSGAAFSADSVGVGVASPETTLHVVGKTLINNGSLGNPTNGSYGGDGTRVVLWPGSFSRTPYGFGIASNTLWYGAPSTASHSWFSGTTETMSLNPSGDLRVSGHLTLGPGGFIDDDAQPGGDADDWIKLDGYIDMKSSIDTHGIVLRDKDDSVNYMNLTQVGGASYFADTNSYSQYFLKGDGRNAYVAGNLGIGTEAAGEKLVVNGGSDNNGTTGAVRINSTMLIDGNEIDVTDGPLFLQNNGVSKNVVIADGASYNDVALSIKPESGDRWAIYIEAGPSGGEAAKPGGGSWANSSDERLKKDISTLEGSLDRLMELRSVSFKYKDPAAIGYEDREYTGFIAQEAEEIFPKWVSDGPNGFKMLSITGFESETVQALRELREEKDAQLAERDVKIADLEGRLAKLEALLVK